MGYGVSFNMQATSRRAKRYKEPGSITMWIFLISLESLALDLFYRSEKSVQVTIFQIFISYPMNSSSLVQSTISFCNYCKPGLCRGLSVSIWAMYFLNLGTVPLLQTKTWLWILQLHCGQDNAGMVRSHAFHVGQFHACQPVFQNYTLHFLNNFASVPTIPTALVSICQDWWSWWRMARLS